MSQSLGSIYVELSANTAKFVDGMSKAAYVAQQSARDISKEFSSLQRVASQTFGAFGSFNPIVSQLSFVLSQASRASADAMASFGKVSGAMGAIASIGAGAAAGTAILTGGLLAAAARSTESAAKMFDLSQATGVSVEALSGLSLVAKQFDVSGEAMATGLERMSRSAFAAATAPSGAINAYTRLGISVKDSANQMLPAQVIFTQIASRFAAMADGPAKTALAIQLFGRSGAELIPVLNQGGQGVQQLLDLFQKLGAVLSGETAENAEKFQRTIGLLSVAADGVSNQFMSEMLPSLQAIASALLSTADNGRTTLENLTHWTVEFVKGTLGVLNTWIHAFEQVGIVLEAAGRQLSGLYHMAEANARFAALDFSGADASAKQGMQELTGTFASFWDETKKNWKDNADFINSLTFHPNYTVAGGFAAGEDFLKKPRSSSGYDGQAEGVSKLRSELASLAEKYQLAAAAAGKTTAATEDLRLKMLGAAPAQVAAIDHLREMAGAAELAAGPLGSLGKFFYGGIERPTGASAGELEKMQDMYGGLSAAGEKWIQSLNDQRDAMNGVVLAADPLKILSFDFSDIPAQQPKSPVQLALDSESAAQYRVESRGGRKSGFDGDVEQLQNIKSALSSVGDSALLVDSAIYDANERWINQLDQAAVKVGTLGEKFKGVLGEIAEEGQDLDSKLFGTLSKGLDDLSSQLSRFIVTGKSNFLQMFQSLGENALKASLQSGFGQLAGLALKASHPPNSSPESPLTGNGLLQLGEIDFDSGLAGGPPSPPGAKQASGYSPLASALAGAFGIKLPGGERNGKVGPTGLLGDPIHVTLDGNAGLGPAKSLGSAPGNSYSVSSLGSLPLSRNTLSSLPISSDGGGNELTGSGLLGLGDMDFGSALANGPTPPGSATGDLSAIAKGAAGTGTQIGGLVSSSINAGLSIAKVLPKIFSFFGGYLANGGDVTPGKAYVVGEKHPEFFLPKQPGTVAPSLKMGSGGQQTTVNFHVHGVKDVDGFQRSQSQIMAAMHAQLAAANSRNG